MSDSDFLDSSCTEQELIELLENAILDTTKDHRNKRIRGLEEVKRRIKTRALQNTDRIINVLLSMTKKRGSAHPERTLLVEAIALLIQNYEETYERVIERLRAGQQEEDLLFLVFSKIVLRLDKDKKRLAIGPLVHFLTTRDSINHLGVIESYETLKHLGKESLGPVITNEISPHLDSLNICAVTYAVKLCSEFADQKLWPHILGVLNKCVIGYYSGQNHVIERDLCVFIERFQNEQFLSSLIDLLRVRLHLSPSHVTKAIGSILEANPSVINDMLDLLYDTHDEELANWMVYSFTQMKKQIVEPHKLLSKIRVNYWSRSPIQFHVKELLVRSGKQAKPVLFELLKDPEKFAYARECLKEIGISNQELSQLFPRHPIIIVYDFLSSQTPGKSKATDLDSLWKDKKRLSQPLPGKTNWSEHLLLTLLAAFNFITLDVANFSFEGIDIVCFYPETLDLFLIGCTTGVLKDDLAKIDRQIDKLEAVAPKLFDMCAITPIVVATDLSSLPQDDEKFAGQQGIGILLKADVEELLEMLATNRQAREVIDYIKEHIPSPPPSNTQMF